MINGSEYVKEIINERRTHRVILYFRVQVKQGEKVLTESGDVYDTTITGGRLGMMVFGQQDVIWSRLEARCIDRLVDRSLPIIIHTASVRLCFYGCSFS